MKIRGEFGMVNDWVIVAIAALLVAVICVAGAAFGWYQAGLQSAAYARQGIEISQWELFMGVSPAERVIQIKSPEKL